VDQIRRTRIEAVPYVYSLTRTNASLPVFNGFPPCKGCWKEYGLAIA
jgi:hypothetical protein